MSYKRIIFQGEPFVEDRCREESVTQIALLMQEVDRLRTDLERVTQERDAFAKQAKSLAYRRSGKFSILPDGSFGPHSDDVKK